MDSPATLPLGNRFDPATVPMSTEPQPSVPAGAVPLRTDPQRTDRFEELRFRFTGTGREYFGIWFTNIALTFMTLGIYSAWAKVRRVEYVYRNTLFGGSGAEGSSVGAAFQYLADPLAILRGRLVAAVLIAAYATYGYFPAWIAILVLGALAAVFPWLMWSGLRFRAARTRHRGQRFHFDGTLQQAYSMILPAVLIFIGPGLVFAAVAGSNLEGWIATHTAAFFIVSFGPWLLAPWVHARYRRWLADHTVWGSLRFSNTVPTRSYYGLYMKAVFLLIGAAFLGGLLFAVMLGAAKAMGGGRYWEALPFIFGILLGWGIFMPYITARLQKLNWQWTFLGEEAFNCDLKARRLIGLQLKNLVLLFLTLGLWRPFGWIAVVKMRVESLWWHGDAGAVLARAALPQGSTAGSESAEFFGADMGF
jgi:uncharacterized membrane protein YjgN (DUF898 family)